MPELPEVETLRRSLEPALVGRSIAGVNVTRRDMLCAPGDPPGGFSRSRSTRPPVRLRPDWLLRGATIARLTRRGKQLGIETPDARAIVVHLGMTGGLRVLDAGERRPAHTHAAWRLDDGRALVFSDARRFGLVRLLPGGTAGHWAVLGPDALTITASALATRLAGTRRGVKAALLDQAVLAGVGNIYADEALFASRIHPEARADRLDRDAVRALAGAIRSILRRAIDRGGSTIRDYRDASGRAGGYQDAHAVYGRGGQPCVRCGGELALSRVAQRATVHCPACQAPDEPR
jgi:formamidopyrimidine-DNA glycosylase